MALGRVIGATGDGVHLRGGTAATSWKFEPCEVSGSAGHGLVLANNVAGVAGCGFFGNAGNGIQNLNDASCIVQARGNWWGDAAGPAGTAGDGVSQGVEASQPLPVPPAQGD